jgi:hypothetical protein
MLFDKYPPANKEKAGIKRTKKKNERNIIYLFIGKSSNTMP